VTVRRTYLAHGGALIPGEAICDLLGGGHNVGEVTAVGLLCFGAHASYGEDLVVLLGALL
jgi:hypothetical protein